MSELTEREQEKLDEIVLDLADDERRAAQNAAGADEPPVSSRWTDCLDGRMSAENHCGNDCGGWADEAGDWQPAEECEHCGCCTCTSCEYARVA
jgi:hypothetical protein